MQMKKIRSNTRFHDGGDEKLSGRRRRNKCFLNGNVKCRKLQIKGNSKNRNSLQIEENFNENNL